MVAAFLGWLPSAQATLSEPDHILYGTVRFFGEPVVDGTVISIVLGGETEPLVTYEMGSDPTLNGLYALRLPMDSVDPRVDGTARPGEAASVFIGDTLAADVMVGAAGEARRVDLDPANQTGLPNLSIQDLGQPEGSSGGLTPFVVTIDISTTSEGTVTFDWATTDGTAVAGTCEDGADYIGASGNAQIAAGELSTTVTVEVCADSDVEPTETFIVSLSSVNLANPVDTQATIEIQDDDEVPTATINNVVILEPASGSSGVAQFTVSLDQVSGETVSLDYQTVDGTAVAGSDYEAASGTVQIPPGNPAGTIQVTVLSDAEVEEDETFTVEFSNPVGIALGTASAQATIVDPAFDPTVQPVGGLVDGGDNDGLSGAGSLLVTRDDTQVLVAGRSEDKIAQLNRNGSDGSIAFDRVYDASASGFADALFDGMADLAQSSDGRWIFLVSNTDDAISIFERTTGGIEFRGNSPLSIPSMDGAISAVLSPDGSHLYVAARGAGALNVFSFDPSGPSLTLLEAESDGVNDPDDEGGEVNGLAGASSVAISRDGESVYVAGNFDNAVAFFQRDTDPASEGFGTLNFSAVYRDNIAGVTGLGAPEELAVSPEGGSVYVIGQAVDSLAHFQRNRLTGSLTFVSSLRSGQNSLFGMQGPSALRMSRDGRLVVVAGFEDNTFVIFDRESIVEDPAFGSLSLADIRRNDETGLTTMVGPSDIDFSQDDKFIYVSSSTGNSVIVLQRFPRGDTVFGGGFE